MNNFKTNPFDEVELLNWSNNWLANNCPPKPPPYVSPSYDPVEYKEMTLNDLNDIQYNTFEDLLSDSFYEPVSYDIEYNYYSQSEEDSDVEIYDYEY